MKTTTTETMKYDAAGCLIERVTVVETHEPSDPVNVVQHIHYPKAEDPPEWVTRHATA